MNERVVVVIKHIACLIACCIVIVLVDSARGNTERLMFNQEHYDLLIQCSEKRDLTEWNKWVRQASCEFQDRSFRIHLAGADLKEAYLKGANLLGADLQKANLSNANMQNSFLAGANLDEADLSFANLRKSNLLVEESNYTNLNGADMRGAIWSHHDFHEASCFGIKIISSDYLINRLRFSDIDLSQIELCENEAEEITFSNDQYNMLIRCSEKGDISEWNEWIKNNSSL